MNSLLSCFDHIYIINLPRRTDRRRAISRDLRRCGILLPSDRIEFFPAIRPAEPGDFPTVGARGCFLSHLSVLRKALAEGQQRIVVMEDDLALHREFSELIGDHCGALQEQRWDIAYLGHVLPTQEGGSPFFQASCAIIQSHFVAFNRTILPRLINFLETVLARPGGHPDGGPMHVDAAYSTFRLRRRDSCRPAKPGQATLQPIRYCRSPAFGSASLWKEPSFLCALDQESLELLTFECLT